MHNLNIVLRAVKGGPVSRVHDLIVTRILLEVLDEKASMSRDWHARHARGSSKVSMKCSICSRIEQGEHDEINDVYRSRTRRFFNIVFNSF